LTLPDQIPLSWAYLPIAFVLGGLHALEPGHGKSLASAYLIGDKHKWKDALILGLATTVSHTAVVILLAFGCLSLKGFVSQNVLEHGIGILGGAALLGVGGWVIVRSIRDLRHGHSHGHTHDHGHSGTPAHGYWGVVLVGLSNGVLPCPGAMAALLVAISLGQVSLGLTTVLVYSLGLAVALSIIGIIAVEAGKRARTWLPSDHTLLWLPFCSGLLVFGTGVWLAASHIG
jgi:ABC-type nickel/cobalt efflux system permease component RcnA